GKQLDMQGAITQLENALSIAKALQNAATASEAHGADTDSQEQLKATLTQLAQSGIIAYAQEGIALTSPENIQLSTSNSVSMTSENQTDINALKNITVSSGESIGLFAHKSGMKVFANQGDVEVQAQNANLNMAAKQDIKIDSVDGELTITASKELTLMCGGSYIKISSAGIELGTAGNVYIKSNALQKMGVDHLNLPSPNLPVPFVDETGQLKIFYHDSNLNPIPRASYRVEFEDGSVREGILDDNGEVLLENTPTGYANVFFGYSTDDPIFPDVEYDAKDYSKAGVIEQLQEYINITPEELDAFIDCHVEYTEEYLEIAEQNNE
ncbi:DUF2345 domain-containing protein, partial [Gilliamella sp. B14448G12]|uniref:DUF2345 domain-containing protein n=4 Tax=Gilliamella TaxID=1193503 RepID=UPI0018DD7ECA